MSIPGNDHRKLRARIVLTESGNDLASAAVLQELHPHNRKNCSAQITAK